MDNGNELEASITALKEVKGLLNVNLVQSDGDATIKEAIDKIDDVLRKLAQLKNDGKCIDEPTRNDRDKSLEYVGWGIRIVDMLTRILDD